MQLEHIYGLRASPTNFITLMINKLKNNEPQIDLTLGEQQRNFIYIDDVVSAYITVVEKQNHIIAPYSTFQVCTNQIISIKELMTTMKDLTNSKSYLNFGAIPYRKNELMQSETNNIDLINLGWKPQYSIQAGLKKMI